MRFESVKAYAFGPFRNESLEFAPGMNVVYGPNEGWEVVVARRALRWPLRDAARTRKGVEE